MKIFSLNRNTENSVVVTAQLLRLLNVNVTQESLQNSLTAHPDYPSIISITDVLYKYKIDSSIIKVAWDDIDKLETPFITRLKFNDGAFVVITKVSKEHIEYLKPHYKITPARISKGNFFELWTGLALFAKSNDHSGELEYSANRKTELRDNLRAPVMLLGFLLLTFLFTTINLAAGSSLYIILALWAKLIGCFVTGALLTYEIDKNNPVLRFVCKPGKKINCTAILNSPVSKLFGWLSWSELGFFYFSGGYLFLLFSGDIALTLFILATLTVVAIPYIFFSIFYQWKIARQWCLLCLIVQFIFITELIVHLSANSFSYIIVSNKAFGTTTFLFILAYLLPILFWIFIKKKLINAKAGEHNKREYFRLKHDPDFFKSHVAAQKKFLITPPYSIAWGNLDSENVITMVCSPYCKPCALAHPIINDILKSTDDLRIELVFSLLNSDRERNEKPMRHLLALYKKQNEQSSIEPSLSDWWQYAQKNDYKGFSQQYPLNKNSLINDDQINSMTQWCEEMQISYTPTFFVNGHELPSTYTVEDVRHILSSWNWDWKDF